MNRFVYKLLLQLVACVCYLHLLTCVTIYFSYPIDFERVLSSSQEALPWFGSRFHYYVAYLHFSVMSVAKFGYGDITWDKPQTSFDIYRLVKTVLGVVSYLLTFSLSFNLFCVFNTAVAIAAESREHFESWFYRLLKKSGVEVPYSFVKSVFKYFDFFVDSSVASILQDNVFYQRMPKDLQRDLDKACIKNLELVFRYYYTQFSKDFVVAMIMHCKPKL